MMYTTEDTSSFTKRELAVTKVCFVEARSFSTCGFTEMLLILLPSRLVLEGVLFRLHTKTFLDTSLLSRLNGCSVIGL